MVNRIKPILDVIVAIAAVISAIGIIGGFLMWLSGAFAGATIAANKLTTLEDRVTDLISQVHRLQDQLNGGVRVDQVTALEHMLSNLQGRVQANDDRNDTRLRDLEGRVSKMEGASGVTLNRR